MKNFLKSAYKKAERYFLENASVQDLNVHAVQKGSGKSEFLEVEIESMQAQTLEEWKLALLLANNLENPDKSLLQSLYNNLLLDNHLGSIIDSRILHSQRSPFKITDNAGNENEELTFLLERTWFEDFVRIALNSRFEGVKLIEIYELDPHTRELLEVEEIPMAHFDAMRGIIKKRPDEQTGWPYKDGQLANHYIQVGKNKDLGLLAKMAPVILSKKLGFGSWLDYVEKYGVGNLFITTDREDAGRLKQLVEAAKNFKASGFMVGRGNEKFEIKGSDAGNPANFDLLIERANSEMSKRILGGSGITDEKSFVGSAEIQFRMAKDRYDSDRLLLKNVINQQLFPRLAKLSPVYLPLANHYFDWQEEPEDPQYLKDLVTGLAPHFELDTEELSQRLGVTIISQKQNKTLPEQEQDVVGERSRTEKKKPKPDVKALFDELTAFYESHHDCGHDNLPEITAVDVETWVKVMERIARDTYDGKIKPGELDPEHIKKTYDELSKGASKSYGKNWNTVDETGKPSAEVIEMRKNIFRFSGAKNAAMLERINQLLTEGGKVKPWNRFKNDVLKLNKSYNVNYLQAEWQTAVEAGRKAQIWKDYQANKERFPNLVYRTQEDDRVREEHDRLKNIVKPIDDPFWDSFYPPNGWRCRCYTVQTAEDPTPDEKLPEITEKDVRLEFRNNVGKTGQIYKENTANGGKPHPYFRLSNLTKYKDAFELMKYNAPYIKIKNTKVRESIFADQRHPNRMENINEAKLISKNLDLAVDILPLIELKNHSSPEFRIKGIIGDGVHRKGSITNTASNAFSNKLGKNGQLSKLDKTFISVNYGKVDKVSNKEFKRIVNSIYGKMTNNKKVEFLIISFNEKSVIIYNKSIPADRTKGFNYIYDKLELLKNTEGNK